jgi:serine/threonine protein phosphatase PrpC
MIRLKSYGAMTDQGPIRVVNEDRYGVYPKIGLFGVFDGLGGGGVGDVASEYVSAQVGEFFTQSAKDEDATLPFTVRNQYLLETNFSLNALIASHKGLFKENQKREFNSRAAVSSIVVSHMESVMSIVGVGNCRIYRVRRGALENLLPVDSISSFSTEPDRAQYRDIPLSAIGYEVEPDFHVLETRIREGDSYWLLSSGISAFLSQGDFQEAGMKGRENPKATVNELIDLATQRGATGNLTVLYLQF